MTFKNATELVIAVENTLGWVPDTTKVGLRQARSIEAGKINAAMKRDPKNVTLDNLELALAYSYRKREPVKNPLALQYRIKAALEEAAEPVVVLTDLSAAVEKALEWEMSQPTPDETWIGRLTRAQGSARADLLANWNGSGRGK